MNLFVGDPEWGWWIILYFYLGGIAAGAYFMATLVDLVGSKRDHDLARVGYFIAFPLILLCGLFLTVDLYRPERFWHMMFKSEIVKSAMAAGWPGTREGWSLMLHAPMLKYWSPMSVGSWALTLFGLCSLLSLLGSIWPEGRLAWMFRRSLFGKLLAIVGCVVGFFIASYTGALLTATNQPIWSDSVWIAPLFLTSSASTGIAAVVLLTRWRCVAGRDSLDRLEHADRWVLFLELAVFTVFLATLGPFIIPMLSTWQGLLLVAGTLLLGVLIPLGLHLRVGEVVGRTEIVAAVCVLVGGFILRYGIITTPPALLARGPTHVVQFSPEEGRARGGGPGADPGNHGDLSKLQPRTEIPDK